jgi:hypothetical protein
MKDQSLSSESIEDASEFALAAHEDWLEATELNASQERLERMHP